MNIKDKISVKSLSDSPNSSLGLAKDDEVVQIVRLGEPIKLIVDQNHYLKLLSLAQSHAREEFPKPETTPNQTP